LIAPSWWNAAVTRTDDIVSGVMTIKACQPEHVVFRDLTLRRFDASCKVSVIIICNRFLQRLRVALRNWCHQDAPSGAFEVLVVNPGSPDGTHEHLRAVARGYPDARICEIAAPIELATNKGALINHAIRDAHGEWIWLTDADCLFPTTAINTVLEYVPDRGNRLFFGERRHLSDSITSALLAGRADAVADFATLASARSDTPPENAPWGYTQIIRRADFGRLRYTESFNHFAHSDGEFIERCKRRGFPLEQVPGLCCLHLEHPFAWHDNDAFL
jgi:glycosyltransferase involved in cell wall biosynthesis